MRRLLKPLGLLLIWAGHKLTGEPTEWVEMEPYGDVTLPPDEAWRALKEGEKA